MPWLFFWHTTHKEKKKSFMTWEGTTKEEEGERKWSKNWCTSTKARDNERNLIFFEGARKYWIETSGKYSLETHYSKSQIFCPKIQFWQNPNIFTSFSPKFFLTIFLVKSKLSTAKKSKTTTFSRVFHPQKIENFLGKSKLNFWTKNEDFEQCVKKPL